MQSCDLPPELAEKAKRELNECPSSRNDKIQELRTLLKDEADLYSRTDDAFLLRFLRARKFRVEAAFHLVKNYYRHRRDNPELFNKMEPLQMKHALSYNLQTSLAEKDSEGRVVGILKFGSWRSNYYSAEDMIRLGYMMTEQSLLEPAVQVNGFVAIVDFKGMGHHHLRQFPPSALRTVFTLARDCYPQRFQALHIINEPSIFDFFAVMAKPFLSEKLLKRVHLHGSNMESLHKFVPPEILPKEYGGLAGPMDNSHICELMFSNNHMYVEDKTYGYAKTGKD